ncbi:type VI secretion system baseplate subunit TssG [Paraferrimonas sedimenticola]|uniref:Type VI secretion system protein ImpH n=1 Tax=Paraferrimonas sedimenticola TaxID=375674 RepID=A0AA37RXB4_9GAMM|nr:type VI secretion system baseplate subunit TssG [Paraferrimonas sedimenticola]GLP96841.1 hypothetical protein GCM10007895_21470 [Paraferrimonas sedimenticola]
MKQLTQMTTEPWQWDLFAALSEIESQQQGPAFGRATSPSKETVRIGQSSSMSFAASDILSCRAITNNRLALTQSVYGLLGSQGPMPLHFTELVHSQIQKDKNAALLGLVNLFNHRSAMFFYRAWKQNQPSNDSQFSDILHGLVGHTKVSESRPLWQRIRAYYGIIGSQELSCKRMQSIASDAIGMPVAASDFVGNWFPLPEGLQGRLGRSVLGNDSHLGNRFYSQDLTVRFDITCSSLDDYLKLLPGGSSWQTMMAVVTATTAGRRNCQVRMSLDALESEQETCLNGQQRLGMSAWLGSKGNSIRLGLVRNLDVEL